MLEDRDIEPLLRAEMLEGEAVGNARGLGDVVDRDLVVVALGEEVEGDGDQLLTALLGTGGGEWCAGGGDDRLLGP